MRIIMLINGSTLYWKIFLNFFISKDIAWLKFLSVEILKIKNVIVIGISK